MNSKNRLIKKAPGAFRPASGRLGPAILAVSLVASALLPARDDVQVSAPPALAKLQWMVGSWIHDSEGMVVKMVVSWSEDRSSVQRKLEWRLGTAPVLRVCQTLYWDPVRNQVRSQGQSSDGSTTTGVWQVSRKGGRNTCEITFADGRLGTAVNTWQLDEFNQCVFTSTERRIDGRSEPDIAPTEFGADRGPDGFEDQVAAVEGR